MKNLFSCCMPKDLNNITKQADILLDDDIKNSNDNENQDFNAFITKNNNKNENGQIGMKKSVKSLDFHAESFKQLNHTKYTLNYQTDQPHKTFILDRLKLLHTCNGNKNDFKRELSKTYNQEIKEETKGNRMETSVSIFIIRGIIIRI